MSNGNTETFLTGFRGRFLITLVLLVAILALLGQFLTGIEQRSGVMFPDPILAVLPPADLTWLIFALIYGALVLAIVYMVRHPARLMLALQSYMLLALSRMVAMFLLPLDPPAGMIPLVDPLVELFGSGGTTLSRDLFFSGHTSTLFLLALVIPNRKLSAVFLLCTALVGCAVLVQHVHYSIDVLAAPFFTYACFAAARKLRLWQATPAALPTAE
jgi:hypothetical protein